MHENYMRRALELAKCARNLGEVPVGAVVVLDNEIIGSGFNCSISNCDPSAHAEVMALRSAAKKIGNYRLSGANLYVTLEPCTMCAGLLIHARIAHLIFGAYEKRTGAIHTCDKLLAKSYHNHKVMVTHGVLADECTKLIQDFFQHKRKQSKSV